MFNYFKMKKAEWRVKKEIYSGIEDFLDNKEDLFEILRDLYNSLKDANADEIKEIFVGKLAELVHKSGEENREQKNVDLKNENSEPVNIMS